MSMKVIFPQLILPVLGGFQNSPLISKNEYDDKKTNTKKQRYRGSAQGLCIQTLKSKRTIVTT